MKVLRKQQAPTQIIPYCSQMPHALSRYENWMTPPDDVDSREVGSVLSLLDYLRSSDVPVEFQPINDIPGAFGAEIYFRSKKIAEIFVAENREGIIPKQSLQRPCREVCCQA
ncbi:MAG: hypothetical protein AAGB19_23200 [Cyanobacteria bacterium P01_F01_bin.3]